MKIVLAGSPQISIEAFEEVIQNFDVVAVVTQPDKPKGRGMKLTATPVSILAEKYNIKTFKPSKIGEIEEELKSLDFDQFLTFAYGQFVPTKILKLGKNKPLNIHGSLLPLYRGAAPIHHAILSGDKKIGITLMEMVKEMDAGDMFFKASKEITEETTVGEGFEIISDLAKDNIVTWLKKIEQGEAYPEEQGRLFTHAPKIEKKFAKVTSDMKKTDIKRKVKGLNPFPGAFTIVNDKRLKIFNLSFEEIDSAIEFKCKDGKVYFTEYQWEGKKRISIPML